MHDITTASNIEPVPITERRSWTLLVLLCVAQFMVIVDLTVVNVALPTIGQALRFASAADLQWVASAYVLVSGGLVLLGGRASDLLGRRKVFLSGLLVFTTASLASGLAPSAPLLVVARAAQGAGASMLTPAALSIITTAYSGAQRAVGLATWGAIGAAGAAAGVLLGGVLTTWLGWRSVFFINVPIGVFTAGFAVRLVPTSPVRLRHLRELDISGAIVLIAGLVLLVYAMRGAALTGWASAHTLIPLLLSLGFLAAFGVLERNASQPLLPGSVWRVRSLRSGVAVMLGATGIMSGSFFLNSLYLQRVLSASALETGLAFLPFALVIVVAAYVGSRVIGQHGTRVVMVLGLIATAAGALFLAQVPDHATYLTSVLPGFLAIGLGIGLCFVAVSITAMADVESEFAGMASGLMTTGHEIGAALGVATLSAIATAAATSMSFTTGYRVGMLTASLLAVALSLFALVAIPAVRPTAGSHARIH